MISISNHRLCLRLLLGLCVAFCAISSDSVAAPDDDLTQLFNDIEEKIAEGSTSDSQSEDAEITELSSSAVDLLDTHQKRKFSGWGSYTREFKDLCAAIAADGREAQLKQIVDRYLVREDTCPACYPLMKILSRTCAPKKAPKAKKTKKKQEDAESESEESAVAPAEAPATVVALQREPNMQVDLFLQALLERLSEDPPRRDEGMVALKHLSERLISANYQQLPGERDYFSAVQSVMDGFLDQQAHFREKQAEREQVEDGVHIADKPEESVDELFDYN